MSLQLRYTGFFVRDVPATVDFYQRAFGLELRYLHPSRGYAEMATGDTLLCFVGEAFVDSAQLLGGLEFRGNRPSEPPAGAQLAFISPDVEADFARALSAGATLVKALQPKPWGQTSGYLRDLDGIIVELCTPSPRD